MQYNFIILRTDKGGRYARKILRSIKWLNENKYPQHEFSLTNITIGDFLHNLNDIERNYRPENTIIHARAANPRTEWTIKLRRLQDMWYKVVNSVDCIELTSNKLACSLRLQEKVAHPKSWEYKKGMNFEEFSELWSDIELSLNEDDEYVIAKPFTSLEQGANVRKIPFQNMTTRMIQVEFEKVPGKNIVIQEYVPYTALHRVIVIGGKALPYTFVDYADDPRKNGEWKVSCCLNRTTMRFNGNPPPRLLQLAEQTQKEVGGIINFIDIFEFPWKDGENRPRDMFGNFTNAEINTACSLNIHEKLAKDAGRRDWNIHYRIAKELVKQIGV